MTDCFSLDSKASGTVWGDTWLTSMAIDECCLPVICARRKKRKKGVELEIARYFSVFFLSVFFSYSRLSPLWDGAAAVLPPDPVFLPLHFMFILCASLFTHNISKCHN